MTNTATTPDPKINCLLYLLSFWSIFKKDKKIIKIVKIKDRVFILDCFQIARDTIGKAIPNTPMLGAFMKVSQMFELDYFKEKMKGVLKKLPQNVIDANMIAIQRAYDEVH